jgi:hypothetical protein
MINFIDESKSHLYSLANKPAKQLGCNERKRDTMILLCTLFNTASFAAPHVSEEDAKNGPRTVASLAMAVRCSNHYSARSHSQVLI